MPTKNFVLRKSVIVPSQEDWSWTLALTMSIQGKSQKNTGEEKVRGNTSKEDACFV